MRGIDTNVLVRYLAADDRKQLALAEHTIEECHKNGEQLYLTMPALCELVWVLSRSYGQSKAAIIATLEMILQMELFRIERVSLIHRALAAYRGGKGDFADYVIGEIGRHAGCRDTVTFDRALKGAPQFTLLA